MSVIKVLRQKSARIFELAGQHNFLKWIPDKTYLKILYRLKLGKELNIDKPQTFNEKLQWLKLNDRQPEYSRYVDKYAVRSYIAETIGGQYLIPLIGVYNNASEIPWNSFPKQFVLKCTHGSAANIICTNKDDLDIKNAIRKLNNWLKQSWYWAGREWPYYNVSQKIICEHFLGDIAQVPNDYKIMCFNGEPKIIQIHKKHNEIHTIDFYDMNGNLLPFQKIGYGNSKDVPKINIESLREMLELARILSRGKRYIRTDFYFVTGKIYFGEMTFYDSSGLIDFEPIESNVFLGDLLCLE